MASTASESSSTTTGSRYSGQQLAHLRVDHELLVRRRESAFEPPGRVVDDIGVSHHRRPQRHLALVRGLGIDRVRGVRAARTKGHPVAPGELAAGLGRLCILGRAECGSAGLHVHVGRESPVYDGRARTHDLAQHHAGERLGVLQRERACDGDRSHGAEQRERSHDDRLADRGELDHPVRHVLVELARGVRVDVAADNRLRRKLVSSHPVRDAGHLHSVVRPIPAEQRRPPDLVVQRDRGMVLVQVARRGGQVQWRKGRRTAQVDDVERVRQLHEVAEVLVVSGAAAAVEIGDEGRPADKAEVDDVAAVGERLRGVAGLDGERRRRQRDVLLDHGRIEPYHRRVAVCARPRTDEERPRLRAQHLHSDVAQDPKRCHVDRFDLVLAQHPGRRMRIAYRAPGQALDVVRCAAALAPVPACASSGGDGHRTDGLRGGNRKETPPSWACQAAFGPPPRSGPCRPTDLSSNRCIALWAMSAILRLTRRA